jgi:hypothetical protein
MIKSLAISFGLLLAACKCPPSDTTPAGGGGGAAPMATNLHNTEIRFTCGGEFYLSTGTPNGECATTADANGQVTGGTCDDHAGNAAVVACENKSSPEGDTWSFGRCVSTTGQGACDAGGGGGGGY